MCDQRDESGDASTKALPWLAMRDAALEDPAPDDYRAEWKRLSATLESVQLPFAVAVDGRWGTGKTRMLRAFHALARAADQPAVWFPAWEYAAHKTDIVPALLRRISAAHAHAFEDRKRRALVWGGAAAAVDGAMALMGKSGSLSKAQDAIRKATQAEAEELGLKFTLFEDPVAVTKSDFLFATGRIASAYAQPLLVLVDDLDRLDPATALDVLESVRTLMLCCRDEEISAADRARDMNVYGEALPSRAPVCFLFGLDLATIRAAILRRYGEDGDQGAAFADAYIKKVFGLMWRVPPLENAQAADLLSRSGGLPRGLDWNPTEGLKRVCDKMPVHPLVTWRAVRYAWDKALVVLGQRAEDGRPVDEATAAALFCVALLQQVANNEIPAVSEAALARTEFEGVPAGLQRDLLITFNELITDITARPRIWSQAFREVMALGGIERNS